MRLYEIDPWLLWTTLWHRTAIVGKITRGRTCFYASAKVVSSYVFTLTFCLSVCLQNNSNTYGRILMNCFGGCITSSRFWSRSRGRHRNFTIGVSECLIAPGFDASWHPYESLVLIEMTSGLCNTNCPNLLVIDIPESLLAKESVMKNSSKRHLFVYTDNVFSCVIFQLFSHFLLKTISWISRRISW